MEYATCKRDPIDHLFFQDKALRAQGSVEGLIFERHQKKQAVEKTALAEENQPSSETIPKENVTTQSVHNSLIETMQNKKRTQPSLSDFLNDKEART
jgi:hypothetical protein